MEHSTIAESPSAGPGPQGEIVGLRVRSAGLVAAGVALLLGIDFVFSTEVGSHIAGFLCIAFGLAEFYGLCRAKGAMPQQWMGIVAAMSLSAVQIACIKTRTPLTQPLGGAGVAVVLATLVAHMATSRKDGFLIDVATTILGMLYVWFLGVFFFVGLRHLPNGLAAVVVMLAAGKGGDSIAYGVGRKYGRTKMIPRISPNKSYEGAIAGGVSSVLIAVLLNWVFSLWGYVFLTLPQATLYGVAVGGSSIVGDLIESSFKRSAGMKDSGRIFARYGGALDAADSIVMAGPVCYFLMVYYAR